MRSTWWLAAVLVLGCSERGIGLGDDTGDTEDTDDTDSGETDTQDSETEEPDPVTYADHDGILFELAQPVAWTPLEWEEELWSDTIAGYAASFTVGAEVTGATDIELKVDSHLVQAQNGDWVQYFEGVTGGGKLDAVMDINFPLVVSIDNFQFDLAALAGPLVGLPELSQALPQHVFKTLALGLDSEASTYTASTFNWTWTSGIIDPADWAPFVEVTIDLDINYETVFNATTYDLYPRSNTTKIASQTRAADRLVVNTQVGAPGDEATQARFDSIAKGELINQLVLDGTITLHLWYTTGPNLNLPFNTTMNLGDIGKTGVTFTKEAVNHNQAPAQ